MKKYNIQAENIEFKNLYSGPAPVGRILNYIYIIGTKGLKHKNGNRTVYSDDGIGYAWTTEFMIGLGLIKLGSPIGNAIKLDLTEKGFQLFNLIKESPVEFDDGSQEKNIKNVRTQMNNCHPNLYQTFKEVFFKSYPYLILRDYLSENGYHYTQLRDFYDNFFEYVGNLYSINTDSNNAGFNRLPSLIQLCKLFQLVKTEDNVVFDQKAIERSEVTISEYTQTELKTAATEEKKLIVFATEFLVDKYGEDGNVIISSIVRNSSLQAKFKHNLTVQQKSKCVICGMENKELLIGSHIKASAKCDVKEKIDYNNGLLFCCNHDKIFDRHLITFNAQNGKIKISKSLSNSDIELLNLSYDYALPKELLTKERKKYLELHNAEFELLEKER